MRNKIVSMGEQKRMLLKQKNGKKSLNCRNGFGFKKSLNMPKG